MFAYIILILPFKVAFVEDESLVFNVFDYIIDSLFVLDIILSAFMGTMENGVVIDDVKILWSQYFRAWFWFDLFSTIPWDYFINLDDSYVFLTKISKLLKILKMLRLARI